MIELLKNITTVWKAIFTEWIPMIDSVDLGIWGEITTAIAVIGIAIKIIRKRID